MKSNLRLMTVAGVAAFCIAVAHGRSLQDQVAPGTPASQVPKSFVDCSPEELIARYPALKETLKPGENREALAPLLARLGKNVQEFIRYFPNTACTEEIQQEAYDPGGSVRRASHKYQYVIVGYPYIVSMDEYRTNSRGTELEIRGLSEGFLLTSGFAALSLAFHPIHQSGTRFRYLGTASDPRCEVLAFAQIPGLATIQHEFHVFGRAKGTVYFEGLVWLDSASFQVVRMHTELLAPATQIGLESSVSDLDFEPVVFDGVAREFWLPRQVSITTRWGARTYRNRHVYSDYKLFTVESYDKVKPPKPPAPQR